jgi:hypothetical protein
MFDIININVLVPTWEFLLVLYTVSLLFNVGAIAFAVIRKDFYTMDKVARDTHLIKYIREKYLYNKPYTRNVEFFIFSGPLGSILIIYFILK